MNWRVKAQFAVRFRMVAGWNVCCAEGEKAVVKGFTLWPFPPLEEFLFFFLSKVEPQTAGTFVSFESNLEKTIDFWFIHRYSFYRHKLVSQVGAWLAAKKHIKDQPACVIDG
jgi:hypothetical protein